MLLGQPIENRSNVAFCLGAVLFELGKALDGIKATFETPGPTGREVCCVPMFVPSLMGLYMSKSPSLQHYLGV
jgi:hypothetical protein